MNCKHTNQPRKPDSGNPWFFRGVLFGVPFLIVIILECSLRLFGYNSAVDQVFVPYEYHEDYLTTNPEIGRRYFRGSYGAFGTQDVFRKSKPDSTLRIFVLGGSTTAGYPYRFSGTFPALLKQRLREAYPQYQLEVVNLGMTAVMSYTVREFARECLKYDPDLLIIYAGHNEFYGALGSGSSQHSLFPSNRRFTLALQQLKRLKLFQLVQQALGGIRTAMNTGQKAEGHGTLMARMAQQQAIPYNSPVYRNTLNIFRENLEDIVSWAQEKNIPVVLGTLVSNVKDLSPFVSVSQPGTDLDYFTSRLDSVSSLLAHGSYSAALDIGSRLLSQDSMYAQTRFLLGKILEGLGDTKTAKNHYETARDLDGLRFRASRDANQILKEIGHREGVYLCDIEPWFERASPDSLIGNNLILEHLHPNLKGYFLMAKAFEATIHKYRLLNADEPVQLPSDEYFLSHMAVTDLDKTIADFRIRILTSGWPFTESNRFLSTTDLPDSTLIQQLAKAVLNGDSNYEKAHVQLAEHYHSSGDIDRAIEEYYTLATSFTANESPWKKLSQLYLQKGRFDNAIETLTQTLKLTEDAYSHKWLGTVYLNRNRADIAVTHLSRAVKLNPLDDQARYNLGGALFLSGDTLKALTQIERVLKQNPNFPDARRFYDQLVRATRDPSSQ